jgi:hypothetical protein
MDESTFWSIRHRVPILDGEYYGSWKTKMLGIFSEYNLSKYISSPYVPPIDPLHLTPDEELNMLRNLRTMNLIVRGLPNRVLRNMENFECAYTMWSYLENLYLDYFLKGLNEFLYKTIAFNKMQTSI